MKNTLLFLLGLLVFSTSCDFKKKERKREESYVFTPEETQEAALVNFYYYEEEAEYPDAIVELFSPLEEQNFAPGRVPFEFNIKNFPFGEGLSGFQLQLILNGGDPVGHRMPLFGQDLRTGTYRAVGYLVDAEGLALKEYGNYVFRDFTVGESRPFPEADAPFLAVNLPHEGMRFAAESEVTVDFLVLNGQVGEEGLRVKISLDETCTYIADELSPVRISGIPSGEHVLQIALIDADGQVVEGAFGSVTKRIVVE
ncbi:MAG: hypothetical protein ACXIT9_12780 [Nitritalea sp.]